jgi:serine/threonine-protein kinase
VRQDEDRCLEAEAIRLLVAQQLPAKELARTAQHLGTCGKCRDKIVLAAGGAARPGAGHDPARVARVLSARAPGDSVAGKYRLVSLLGQGAYSSVWRAERLDWRAPVALKLLVPPVEGAKEFYARFEREVRLAAAMRSPQVVQVLDHGTDDATGQAFIALELLEGESLERRLQRSGRLAPAATLPILEQVARAVERAHAVGIVHRDLKPANIFIVRDADREVVKLLDFGMAKSKVRHDLLTMVTSPGTVLGTPAYMSPEQIRSSTDVDHHADLWSFAVIACECLTGRRPFIGRGFIEVALLVLDEKRPVPSQLGPSPAGFDAWFARATHLDRARRHQSARESLEALLASCGSPRAQGQRGEAAQGAPGLATISKALLFVAALSVSVVLWYTTARRGKEPAPTVEQSTAAALGAPRAELEAPAVRSTAASAPAAPAAADPAPPAAAPAPPATVTSAAAASALEPPASATAGSSPRIAPLSDERAAPASEREKVAKRARSKAGERGVSARSTRPARASRKPARQEPASGGEGVQIDLSQ